MGTCVLVCDTCAETDEERFALARSRMKKYTQSCMRGHLPSRKSNGPPTSCYTQSRLQAIPSWISKCRRRCGDDVIDRCGFESILQGRRFHEVPGQPCLASRATRRLTPEQQNGRDDTDGESDTGVNDEVGDLSRRNATSAQWSRPLSPAMRWILTHVSN